MSINDPIWRREKKQIKNNTQSIGNNVLTCSNIHTAWVPREATENVGEKVSKDIEAKKFPKLGEHIKFEFQKAQWALNRINTQKTTCEQHDQTAESQKKEKNL